MKKMIVILFATFVSQVFAQNTYLNQVLLLNEGCYDFAEMEILEPVTVGVYNPEDNSYNTIIEIPDARFASDLIIHQDYFYVAADNKLLKYDLNTYELLYAQDVQGVRNIAIYNDYLFVSKGDSDPVTFGPVFFDSYLDVFSSEDLSYLFNFNTQNGPEWSTENLLINNDKLYVTINNAYEWGNYKGIIGVVDLVSMNYIEEIDLGEEGKNPINLLYKDDLLYTVNNKNWDGSSVSIVNPIDAGIQTVDLSNVSRGCGVSIIRGEELCYQINSSDQVYKLSLDDLNVSGLVENLNYNYYTMELDPINNYLYASVANFISSSAIVIYDLNNNIVNTFFADVATGTIAFDVRQELVSIYDADSKPKNLVNNIDVLGREVNTQDLMINVYDDQSVEKEYIIK